MGRKFGLLLASRRQASVLAVMFVVSKVIVTIAIDDTASEYVKTYRVANYVCLADPKSCMSALGHNANPASRNLRTRQCSIHGGLVRYSL